MTIVCRRQRGTTSRQAAHLLPSEPAASRPRKRSWRGSTSPGTAISTVVTVVSGFNYGDCVDVDWPNINILSGPAAGGGEGVNETKTRTKTRRRRRSRPHRKRSVESIGKREIRGRLQKFFPPKESGTLVT